MAAVDRTTSIMSRILYSDFDGFDIHWILLLHPPTDSSIEMPVVKVLKVKEKVSLCIFTQTNQKFALTVPLYALPMPYELHWAVIRH